MSRLKYGPLSLYAINKRANQPLHLCCLISAFVILSGEHNSSLNLLFEAIVKGSKIHVQIMRFTYCLNMGLNLIILNMSPELFA